MLKRVVSFGLLAVFVLALMLPSSLSNVRSTANPDPPEEAVFDEVCFIRAGASAECVGYRDHAISPAGPESFLIREDGSICVLDSANNRIIVVKSGAKTEYISYEGATYCTYVNNFAYGGGKFYCFDTVTDTIFSVDENTGAVAIVPIDMEIDLGVVSAVEYAGSSLVFEYPEVDEDTLQASLRVVNLNLGNGTTSSVRRDVHVDVQAEGVYAVVDGKEYNFGLKESESQLFGIVGKYSDGSLLTIVCEDAPGVDVIWGENTFRTFDARGNCTGYALIDYSNTFSVPLRHVVIDGNDNTYYMTCELDGVHIYKITFGTSYVSRMDEVIESGKLVDAENERMVSEYGGAG